MNKRGLILFAALAISSPMGFAQGNNFPNHPLSIIVPFSPGSSSDTTARFVAEKLPALLGQAVIVENKPGASGSIPVDKGSCSYGVLWNVFKRVAAACSAGEKAALFGGAASRVYRLTI